MAKELVTRTLKVKVTLLFEMDPDAVNAEYGTNDDDFQIAEFIEGTAREVAANAVAHIPTVTLKEAGAK